jgi:hypothetical protein
MYYICIYKQFNIRIMSGCYGNDSFDRYWESQLDNYLEDYDEDDQEEEEDEDYEYERLNDK